MASMRVCNVSAVAALIGGSCVVGGAWAGPTAVGGRALETGTALAVASPLSADWVRGAEAGELDYGCDRLGVEASHALVWERTGNLEAEGLRVAELLELSPAVQHPLVRSLAVTRIHWRPSLEAARAVARGDANDLGTPVRVPGLEAEGEADAMDAAIERSFERDLDRAADREDEGLGPMWERVASLGLAWL
jgi:hypothetical protein